MNREVCGKRFGAAVQNFEAQVERHFEQIVPGVKFGGVNRGVNKSKDLQLFHLVFKVTRT